MSSQETLPSSGGTAIPPEGSTGTPHRSIRSDDIDIGLLQPTASGLKLEILPDIDNPAGDYKAQHPQGLEHNLREPPPVPDLVSELSKEIVDQFYAARFQQLEQEHAFNFGSVACEDDLLNLDTSDDDE